MTTAELYRALANEVEQREQLESVVRQLRVELEQTRAAVSAALPKQWFTTEEAADYVGRSKSFLDKDRMVTPPIIPFRRDSPKVIRYSRQDLDVFNHSNNSECRRSKEVRR